LAPEPARIRADIERTRLEVVRSIDDVRLELWRAADWREWYRRHPEALLVGAFAIGFLIGTGRRDRP
jgi:hypothetical protein